MDEEIQDADTITCSYVFFKLLFVLAPKYIGIREACPTCSLCCLFSSLSLQDREKREKERERDREREIEEKKKERERERELFIGS